MKIAYILPISWGGIPHYAAELANSVSKYAEVTVLKPKDSNDGLFSKNIEVINAFKPLDFLRKNTTKMFSLRNAINFFSFKNIKLIDAIQPDIVHFPELYLHSSIFAFIHRIDKKYPIVSTLHTVFEPRLYLSSTETKNFTYGLIGSINEFIKHLVKSDALIVHTQKNRDTLIKRGYNPKKIFVIPHGVYNFFKKYDENGTEEEENCILFFGYIVKAKGVEYLIRAVPIISKKFPNVKVIIAGEGILPQIPDKSNFEIYNNFIPNEMVPKLFNRAKIVVLPYLYVDGHSGVLTIAFSFGKPVVVTNIDGLTDLVKNEREGLVVPPRNPEMLANAIIRILEDEEMRKKMSRNALKIAEELSWDNIARKHIQLYEGLLSLD
jgi:glycosyltransferase involved in cell wall biosynthesis